MAASYRGAVEDKRTFQSHHFSNAYFQPNNPRGAGFILDKNRKPLETDGVSSKETSYVGDPLIEVENVDLLKVANEGLHNTGMFDTTKAVLRRGTTFKCRLILSKEYDRNKHAIIVEFRQGTRPSFTGASRFESIIGRSSTHSWQWKGRIECTVEKSVDVCVDIPADAPVAEYEVIGEVVDLGTNRKNSKVAGRTAVILFNPWSKDDNVFMESDDERQEYIASSYGKIWTGLVDEPIAWPWAYEQFASSTLETVLYLLEKSGIDNELRRSPVHVARMCTAMVNADDDDGGILTSNWSEDFTGGIPPTAWSGSGAILEEFLKTRKPVKWAQCWVFGGVLTSVLRCLGIPSRPVTNYLSHQNSRAGLSSTAHLDAKTLTLDNTEMWNYHVWVEGWMERPDLKEAYGGWQALDATPQPYNEQSKVFTIGPAPVAAVQQGKFVRYDTEFMTSVVSGQMRCVLSSNEQEVTFKTATAGRAILTKSVGSEDPVDLVSSYKEVTANGEHQSETMSVGEMELSIVSSARTPIGQDFKFTMVVVSSATAEQSIDFWARVSTASYTGVLGEVLMSSTESRTLVPGGRIEVPFIITAAEYMGKLTNQFYANITINVKVKDAEMPITDTLQLKPPQCTLVADQHALHVGQSTKVRASFKNPLNMVLNRAEWYIEGAGLTRPLVIPREPVQPGKEATVEFDVTASNARELVRPLVVSFSSSELTGVKGKLMFPIGKKTIEIGTSDPNTSS